MTIPLPERKRKVRAKLDFVTDHTGKPISVYYHSGGIYFRRKYQRVSRSVPLQDIYEKLVAKQAPLRFT